MRLRLPARLGQPKNPNDPRKDVLAHQDTFGLFLIQFRLDLQSVKSEKQRANTEWKLDGEGDSKYI